jgi:hypothetical protein
MNYICFEEDALILYNTHKLNKVLCFKYSPFTIVIVCLSSSNPIIQESDHQI